MDKLISFPTTRVRAACYACFDFSPGNDQVCPVCKRGMGQRLAENARPKRPPMFPSDFTT